MVELVWSVEKFLAQYTSESTTRMYKSALMQYFSLVYPELNEIKDKESKLQKLNELSIKYFSEERDIRDDIINYRNSLMKYAPKSRLARLTPTFRYLEDNGQSFPRNFLKNINGKANEPISKEKVPTAEEIKRILEYLPIHSKCLAIVLSSSGMRSGEALQLSLDDIDLNRNPVRILIPYNMTKTKKRRIAYMSQEAKEVVEEWLTYRPEFIRRANRRGLSMRNGFTAEDDPRLFPFSNQTFLNHWRNALEKAGLLELDNRRITLRPHNLRKYFRTRGEWTKPEIAEALMGHQAGLNAVYARYDQAEEILAEEYLRVEPSLSIYSRTKTVIKLQQQVDTQSEDMKTLITSLSVENVQMKNRIEELNKGIEKLTERLGSLDGLKERIEELEDYVDIGVLRKEAERVENVREIKYDPAKDQRRLVK